MGQDRIFTIVIWVKMEYTEVKLDISVDNVG